MLTAGTVTVSYIALFPCMLAVYAMTGRLGLSQGGFAALTLVITVALAEYSWFVPGVDALIAACITMALANFSAWFIDTWLMEEVLVEQQPRARNFCSKVTHDYAVRPRDSVFAIGHINNNEWTQLASAITNMSAVERQGFYANLNYSSVSERSLQAIINKHPEDADAHILMGHVQLCLAKRLGLKPGAHLDEPVALVIGRAFRHFNTALRMKPDDAEALCGLLMAKGFTGLRNEHIMQSLDKLLKADPGHLHGVIAAARFSVVSSSHANEFVSLTESAVNGRSDATVAIAKIIAHIECISIVENGTNNSQVVADLYEQLRCYKRQTDSLGTWQRGISDNVVAYMLQLIGDKEGSKQYLHQIDGSVSPYPWQSNSTAE